MNDEISDAIKEKEFEDAALTIIKSKHHHDDGTEVVIRPIDEAESGIERKIIEDENAWKLKSQNQSASEEIFKSDTPSKKEEIQEVQPVEIIKEKIILGGCNCGQIFSTTFSNDKSPEQGEIKLKAYDASGSTISTYTTAGAQNQDYATSGTPNEDYAKK